MRYLIEKNYTEFIKEVIEERRIKYGVTEEEITEEEIKNQKNELRKILKVLGMTSVLDDIRYKKNNQKIFPIHFQVLCKTLLLQKRSTKKDFVYKIKNNRWELITDSEVEAFAKDMAQELICWFVNLEYQPVHKDGRDKETLDKIYLEIEEAMIEDCTTEYIDELHESEEYTGTEIEYLRTKFWIRQQCNVFVDCLQLNLIYKCKIGRMMKVIHEKIDTCVEQILDIKSVEENLILLHDYESALLGKIPVPQIYVDNNAEDKKEYQLNNKQKSLFLDALYSDILQDLEVLEKCTDEFKGRKKEYGIMFDDEKTIKKIKNIIELEIKNN